MDGQPPSGYADNQRFWQGISKLPERGQRDFWDAGGQISGYLGEPATPRLIDITQTPPDMPWYERIFYYIGASSYNEAVMQQEAGKQMVAAAGWIGSALQGDFNKSPTTGQVIVGGIISLIPFVDQACDVRDVVANCLTLSDPKERENTENWVALGLTCIGFIPEIGSAVKTVAKTALKSAKNLLELLKVMEHLESTFGKLGIKLPWGRAPIAWLRSFQWEAKAREAARVAKAAFTKARDLAQSAANHAFGAIEAKLRQLVETFNAIIAKVEQAIVDAAKKVKEKIEQWLPNEKKEAGNYHGEPGGAPDGKKPHEQHEIDPAVLHDRARVTELSNEAKEAEKRGDKALAAKKIEEARGVLRPYIPKNGSNDWGPFVDRLDVSSPKDGAVFWSGAKDQAAAFAEKNGGVTLETTSGGRVMDGWDEVNNLPWKDGDGATPPFASTAWREASAKYAQGVTGDVNVVQAASRAPNGGQIWQEVEQPILTNGQRTGQVGSINYTVVPGI